MPEMISRGPCDWDVVPNIAVNLEHLSHVVDFAISC
jgi:hypothetical protein